MKYRNNTVVTIEEIREIIDRRGLASQIKEGFDIQKEEHLSACELLLEDRYPYLPLHCRYRQVFARIFGG